MKNYFGIYHNKEYQTFNFHSHDFYEIYFFLDGDVKYYIENESYTLAKGDVLIIPPGKIHRPVVEESTAYERYILWLHNSFISSNKGAEEYIKEISHMVGEKNTRKVSFKGEACNVLTKLFNGLLRDFLSNEPLARYTAESYITLILGEIFASFRRAEKIDDEQGNIIRRVIAYINQNVADTPSLAELSAEFFVSKYYLSHKFKEYTKTTVHQYIIMKKINMAKELLEKGESPKCVSEKCGFSTYSNFYKAFTKQTGISPKVYRK